MAEEVSIPLDVLLAFGFGITLGALIVFGWLFHEAEEATTVPLYSQALSVQRDELGRIVGIQGAG